MQIKRFPHLFSRDALTDDFGVFADHERRTGAVIGHAPHSGPRKRQ